MGGEPLDLGHADLVASWAGMRMPSLPADITVLSVVGGDVETQGWGGGGNAQGLLLFSCGVVLWDCASVPRPGNDGDYEAFSLGCSNRLLWHLPTRLTLTHRTHTMNISLSQEERTAERSDSDE